MTTKNPEMNAVKRQPMSNTKLLMLIAIGIFVVMYTAAMIFIGKRFLTVREIFNLLNNNAYLILLGCCGTSPATLASVGFAVCTRSGVTCTFV